MKLVKIQEEEFNKLVNGEPGRSVFQTSNWAKYYTSKNYNVYYLGYVDNKNIYSAFAMILVKDGFFLSRKEAICPFGFLVNYYDMNILKDFTKDIKKFLSLRNVFTLTINPNLKYLTSKGNNDYLIKCLSDIGYKKTNDNCIYTQEVTQEDINNSNVNLNTYEVTDTDELKRLLISNVDYKNLYSAFKGHIKFIICALNSELQTSDNCPDLQKPHFRELIEECTKEHGNNPVIAVSVIVEYMDKYVQIVFDEKEKYKEFNAADAINNKINEISRNAEHTSFDSLMSNSRNTKVDLIGTFTFDVK